MSYLVFSKISGECGGIFKDKYGHLTSPGFPYLQSFNDSCIYEILQPKNTFIKLTILQFNLTFHTTCNDDFLEIRDGYTAESPLIGKFCGIDIPSTILSSQNNIWLRLSNMGPMAVCNIIRN